MRSHSEIHEGELSVKSVATDKAPAAIGPYSQAIIAGGFLFSAGQIPLDPATGQIVYGGITPQTERVMVKRGPQFVQLVKGYR